MRHIEGGEGAAHWGGGRGGGTGDIKHAAARQRALPHLHPCRPPLPPVHNAQNTQWHGDVVQPPWGPAGDAVERHGRPAAARHLNRKYASVHGAGGQPVHAGCGKGGGGIQLGSRGSVGAAHHGGPRRRGKEGGEGAEETQAAVRHWQLWQQLFQPPGRRAAVHGRASVRCPRVSHCAHARVLPHGRCPPLHQVKVHGCRARRSHRPPRPCEPSQRGVGQGKRGRRLCGNYRCGQLYGSRWHSSAPKLGKRRRSAALGQRRANGNAPVAGLRGNHATNGHTDEG